MHNPSFKTITLPPVLLSLAQQLNNPAAVDENRAAALSIVHGYFDLFADDAVQKQLWQMLCGSMGSRMQSLQTVEACQDLIFFYEFTLLFMQATKCLHGEEN